MKEIQARLGEHGLWLVEDAAHAHGSSFGGIQAGAFGTAAAFSFYPTKVMTAGEGGIITTSDDRIAEEARVGGGGPGSRKALAQGRRARRPAR